MRPKYLSILLQKCCSVLVLLLGISDSIGENEEGKNPGGENETEPELEIFLLQILADIEVSFAILSGRDLISSDKSENSLALKKSDYPESQLQ